MATKTWQNGGVDNNWSTAGNWAEGSKPAAGDDVVMSAAYNCVVNEATAALNSFDMNGYANVLSGSSTITVTVASGTSTVRFANGASGTWSGALNLNPAAGTTINLTCGGWTTWGTVTIAGTTTGNVSLQDAFNIPTAKDLWLTSGTFTSNNNTMSLGRLVAFGASTKTYTLGSSALTIKGTSDCIYLNAVTMTANTAVATCSGTSISISTVGNTNGMSLIVTGGGTSTIGSGTTWANVTVTGTAVKTNIVQWSTAGLTVTGEFKINGNSAVNRILCRNSTLGAAIPLTITGATISNCSNVDFRDITFTNGGSNVDFSSITGGSGDCGGNTISGGGTLSFTTADDWYWNGSGTRNFSDYTYWYTATNGGGSQMGSARCPLPQDTCYIDSSSIDGTTSIALDLPRTPNLDCTGSSAFTFTNPVDVEFYGGLVLSSNVTWTGSVRSLVFYGRGSHSLSCQGKDLYSYVTIASIGGTYTLGSNLVTNTGTSNIGFGLTNGTFDANDYNVSAGYVDWSGSATRTVNMGSGTWTCLRNASNGHWFNSGTVTNLTLNEETSTIVYTNIEAYTGGLYGFNGGGQTYYNFTASASGGNMFVFGSNTFNTFTVNGPKGVRFTAGTTTTVSSFVATGDAGNLIHLASTTTTPATLSDASGTNQVYYCHIGESNYALQAAGGASWLAYTSDGNEVDDDSTGWVTSSGATTTKRRLLMGVGI